MGVRQLDVEVRSGDDVCSAWFFLPATGNESSACIVMGHGLGLTRHCGLREIAVAFADAGFAVLLFDYRGFGDSGGQPRQLISLRKQLEDWAAVITYARAHPEIDSNRIFTWGFSLGAGHALTAADNDERVAGVVAVAPMFDGLRSTLAAMKRWRPLNFVRIMSRAIKDLFGALVHRTPIMVPLAAPPGALGLLTSPDARRGYEALVPSDFNYDTAARIGLIFWSYLPGLRLRRFSRPILILSSNLDRINPPGPTQRHASKCKSATIVELDCEHLEAVIEPTRSRVVGATLDFLHQSASPTRVQ